MSDRQPGPAALVPRRITVKRTLRTASGPDSDPSRLKNFEGSNALSGPPCPEELSTMPAQGALSSLGLHPRSCLVDNPPHRALVDTGPGRDLFKGQLLVSKNDDLHFARRAPRCELSQPVSRLDSLTGTRLLRDHFARDLA